MSKWTLEEGVSWEQVRERAVYHQEVWESRRQRLGKIRTTVKDLEKMRNSGRGEESKKAEYDMKTLNDEVSERVAGGNESAKQTLT